MTEVAVAATGGLSEAEVDISMMKANTVPCPTTAPKPPNKQLSCPKTPPPSIPYISTAELASIYQKCVIQFTIISGDVASYAVDFTAPCGFGLGTTQIVTTVGTKEDSSTFTPENGRNSGTVSNVEITTYVLEKDDVGASVSSRHIGGCADDGEVAGMVYGAVKAQA
jgi:hypothetical protein